MNDYSKDTQNENEAALVPHALPHAGNRSVLQNIFSPLEPARQSKARTWSLRTLWALGLPAYFGFAAIAGWFAYAGLDMPSTEALRAPQSTPKIVILDRHGRTILQKGGAEAVPVNLNNIPPALTQALIAIEDHRYYDHPGFDVIGLARAMRANIKAGHVVQGGSTLTQQLAKNVFLTRNQTMKRKSQEIMLAIWLEHKLSKREILETYLSRVYFGGGTLGIESGAQRFFNKPAKDLNMGEAALLAGILQAPDRLNPVKDTNASAVRTANVLLQMKEQNYLTDAQMEIALAAPIEIEPIAVKIHASAEYFTDWVLSSMDKIIGAPQEDITISTSLDLSAQLAAQRAIAKGVSTERNAQQASLMAFDGTGGVRAMVGGVNYQHSAYNRAVRSQRQAGSAFKPFVYLAALQAGRTPWDIRFDSPVDIDGWKPGNFSNTYKGAMSLETALALSVNTVAVKVSEETGRANVVASAAQMGLGGLKPYASIALGAQEVSLYALTAAYIPFSNWGYRVQPYGIEAIYNKGGQVLYERQPMPKDRILTTVILEQMNMMLRRVVTNGTARAARIDGRDIAGKTGTTNDYRDAWFIGYTQDYVAGVWVGNDDNSKMSRVTGGNIPARIWQEFMSEALKGTLTTKLPMAARRTIQTDEQTLEMLLSDFSQGL